MIGFLVAQRDVFIIFAAVLLGRLCLALVDRCGARKAAGRCAHSHPRLPRPTRAELIAHGILRDPSRWDARTEDRVTSAFKR